MNADRRARQIRPNLSKLQRSLNVSNASPFSAAMQPQYRNRYNFMIFGGYLLKTAFELAFSCAASFGHTRPTFVSLDPSTFDNPVPVGSVLYLTATVAYTDAPPANSVGDSGIALGGDGASRSKWTRVQVRVDSRVRSVEHGERKGTGQFNYTFLVEKEVRVEPRTYSEFMIWVNARRRARLVTASLEAEGVASAKAETEQVTE